MTPTTISRRQLLNAGLAAGGAAVLGACTGSTVRRAASVSPAGSDLGAVEHVVFLMQENRSFDHYFGTYRGVRGFNDHRGADLGPFAQSWPANASKPPAGRLLPFHLDTATTNAECTFDLTHEWGPQHQCWDGGLMDRFVEVHTNPSNEGPDNGVLTMGYYTRRDLAFYYALADAFTICDGYYCSVLGPTDPNRLYALSGTLDPDGRAGGPVLFTNPSPSAKFSVSWTTMPERLQAKGISWKVYSPTGDQYRPASPLAKAVSDNILLYFRQYSDPNSPLYQNAFLPTIDSDFAADVANGRLPQVSWIVSPTFPSGQDEHPPAPPERGEVFTNKVLSALVSNPKVWAKTVMFVSYDENDGFFDHVAPPTPPQGTPGEYLTVKPLPDQAKGVAGPIGLGFRVPLLVISPFSRGGYVSSDPFDHTSQLRFLERRFGVEVPNLSAWRRSVTGDLTTTLRLGSPDTSVPSLPQPADNSAAVIRECQSAQLSEINVPVPPYPLPATQQMPVQESGQVRRSRA
jgi:phospholipase C